MSRKKKFLASAVTMPAIDTNVGVMAKAESIAPSEERLSQLQKQMNSALPQDVTKEVSREEEKIDELFPTAKTQTIERSKLFPAPDEWNFFGKPNIDQYSLIVQSIYQYGLWHPLTVWEQDDGKYMILGGHTRDMAYGDLYTLTKDEKYLTIPCKVYKKEDLSPLDAQRIVILTNVAQRAQENPMVRVRCYVVMAKLEKQSARMRDERIDVAEKLCGIFGVSRRQIFMYMRLTTLIPELMDELEKGKLKLRAAYEISVLPENIQEYIYEKKYFLTAQAKDFKALKEAKTKHDVDQIMSEKESKYQYVCKCTFAKPKGYKLMPLFVHKGDEEATREFLRQSIETEAGKALPEQTRKILLKIVLGE